jgi:hypothetical protein
MRRTYLLIVLKKTRYFYTSLSYVYTMLRALLFLTLPILGLSHRVMAQSPSFTFMAGMGVSPLWSGENNVFYDPLPDPSFALIVRKDIARRSSVGFELGYSVNRFRLVIGPLWWPQPGPPYVASFAKHRFTAHNFSIGGVYGYKFNEQFSWDLTLMGMAHQWEFKTSPTGIHIYSDEDKDQLVDLPVVNGAIRSTFNYSMPCHSRWRINIMPNLSVNFLPVRNKPGEWAHVRKPRYYAFIVGLSLGITYR